MSNPLLDVSNALATAVEASSAGVLRVEARRRRPSTGVLWTEELVVTANHAVEREEGIAIGFADGSEGEARLVGRDASTDLAVLKLARKAGTPVNPSDGADLKVGHLTLAIGRPGRTVRGALGIVGALGQGWRTPGGTQIDRYLEVSVDLPAGFSGGPLVDAAGKVLGINTSGLMRGSAITVPTATVRKVVSELDAHGRMRRGYLGVGAHPVRLPPALQATAKAEGGLILLSIEPGGPADKAGLVLGDTLVKLGDQSVEDLGELWSLLTEEQIGKSVPVRVLRSGQVQELPLVVGQRP